MQILLALLKEHGIKKIVVSPGSANASFVASVQYDKEFEVFSSVDERSAAYIACGLSEESQEPVAICCTGATASRNYVPALTEAYYRKIPIVAITATRPISMVGQNVDQIIDRSNIMNDIAVKSVNIPCVNNDDDAWEVNLKINDALLEMIRKGKGPVHINLTTSYSLDFSVKKLAKERVIHRYFDESNMPQIDKNKKIGIFVGNHSKWSDNLLKEVDEFCEKYNAIVFCDQTSNYKGKYSIQCGMFDLVGFPNKLKIDCLIHLGNISAVWPCGVDDVWRVNPDGEIRDTYKCLKKVFEMEEIEFFKYYNARKKGNSRDSFEKWDNEYKDILKRIEMKEESIPFSSFWIAKNTYKLLPVNSIVHFGILNSLRCWNCFKLDNSIKGYSNTGGFGIDGGVSSLIGASLANSDKIYFGIFGDLAFFYDMNSLGNRHIGKNVRIMIVNNGLGGEFKNSLGNVQKAGLGEEANDYIAAYGHYGNKSATLIKHFAEDLGFEYLAATNKIEYNKQVDRFCCNKKTEKSIIFEVFVNDKDDVEALDFLINLSPNNEGIKEKVISSTKNIIKSIRKM